uniref:Uncharacterized protein n=1 Tax=Anguilla anguilla TaxID=7936 RepID=A0A0E9U8E0_ANGAN
MISYFLEKQKHFDCLNICLHLLFITSQCHVMH